ncbi:MAG: nickel pincer cofactor biosynthesis protein LarC [Acidimicrobiia bacterium]
MRRVAWFNCFNGTAGDMTLGALLDAGADFSEVRSAIDALGIDGWSLQMQRVQRCGVSATHVLVVAPQDHEYHRPFRQIRELLLGASLADVVRDRALATFRELAAVEGAIHDVEPDDVEFHEVGSLDAIVDIVGSSAALTTLGIDEVRCSSVAVGTGTITAAHGVLPNPAPAVVGLLARAGAPANGIDIDLELTTPTGAALMTALSAGFGPMPAMTVRSVGYGAGTRDLPGRPNVLQVVIGESANDRSTTDGQRVRLLEANVDDVTGEVLAHTITALLAVGAHDAWITPITMKKGRPAHTVHALCDPAVADSVAAELIRQTGTLGLRGSTIERWPQQRTEQAVDVDGHTIRVKRTPDRVKVEHDDARAAAVALGLPLREVLRRAESLGTDP